MGRVGEVGRCEGDGESGQEGGGVREMGRVGKRGEM